MVIVLQLLIFFVAAFIRRQFLFGKHLKSYSGQSGVLYYTGQSAGITLARHIGIIQPNGIPFIIRRERWYHRELKKLGISSEIRVSNAEFDKTYFVTTDYPGHLEELLASEKLQQHLQQLFAMPVKSLHATRDKIWCVIKREDFDETNEYFSRHIELLREISQDSSELLAQERASPMWRKRGLAALAFIAFHAGLLALGVLGVFPTLADTIDMIDARAWIWKGVIYGGIASIVWFMFIVSVFKGSSWVSWVLVDFFLCGVLGFMLSGIYIVRDVNVNFVQSPPKVLEKSVLQKVCVLQCKKRQGKSSRRSSYRFETEASCRPQERQSITREKKETDYRCAANAWFEYEIHVGHWGKPSIYSFAAGEALFDRVEKGSSVLIPLNAGALGLEWVDTEQIRAK